jgi:hypothetical protein
MLGSAERHGIGFSCVDEPAVLQTKAADDNVHALLTSSFPVMTTFLLCYAEPWGIHGCSILQLLSAMLWTTVTATGQQ